MDENTLFGLVSGGIILLVLNLIKKIERKMKND